MLFKKKMKINDKIVRMGTFILNKIMELNNYFAQISEMLSKKSYIFSDVRIFTFKHYKQVSILVNRCCCNRHNVIITKSRENTILKKIYKIRILFTFLYLFFLVLITLFLIKNVHFSF